MHAYSYLLLNDNGFTGTIPVGISTMTQLEYLNLRNNFLTGTLPQELTLLTTL